MESYVIRIYRRHESEPERIVGLVEHPENGVVERFSGVTELVNILLSPRQTAAAPPTMEIQKREGASQTDGKDLKKIQNNTIRFRNQ